MIGLELNGEGAVSACQEEVQQLNSQTTGLVFVSANAQAAHAHIDSFFNFADMQMNA